MAHDGRQRRTSTNHRMLPRGGPALVMAAAVGMFVSAVTYSHYAQIRDKAVMRAGVERDKERLRMMRQEKRKRREE